MRPPAVPEPERWKEAAFTIIRKGLAGLSGGPTTGECEAALGVAASCYWYVCQAASAYGHAVFVWSVAADIPADHGGLTPFDSGGCVGGHMKFEPSLDDVGRRIFFHAHNRSPTDWPVVFKSYIDHRHGGADRYLAALPPLNGLPGVVYDPADPRAYYWEARLVRGAPTTQSIPFKLFLTEEGYGGLIDWLDERADEDFAEANQAQEWLAREAVVVEHPTAPAEAVRQAAAAWVAGSGRW